MLISALTLSMVRFPSVSTTISNEMLAPRSISCALAVPLSCDGNDRVQ